MLRYDAAWLIEQYREETPAAPGLPYAKLGGPGPYRIVRHPIYTGLLLAYLSTAIVHGALRGFVGFLLLLLGFGLKLRMEEAFMVQQFGNAYLDYKRRVKALVPFLV